MQNQQQQVPQPEPVNGQANSSANLNANPEPQDKQSESQPKSALVQIFYPVENLLKLYFIIASIFLIPHTDKVGLVVCIMAVLRILKRPAFSKEYLVKFLQNQFGLNIVYIMVMFANGQQKTYLFYGPLALHFLLGITEFLNLKAKNNPIVKRLGPLMKLRQYRDMVLIEKGKLQIYFFISIVCSLLLNFHRILPAILFGQYLYFKHKVSPQFKYSIYEMKQSIDPVLTRIPLISILYKKLNDVLGS